MLTLGQRRRLRESAVCRILGHRWRWTSSHGPAICSQCHTWAPIPPPRAIVDDARRTGGQERGEMRDDPR